MFIITKIETDVYLAEALCVNVRKSHSEESLEEPSPVKHAFPDISFYILIFATFPNHIN